MKSTITITPVENISSDMQVIDNSQIVKETYDSDMDVFTLLHVQSGHVRRSNLMGVSLYDDVIIKGEKKYKILHMLTK